MNGKQDDRMTNPTEERHTRPNEHTELGFHAWSIRIRVQFFLRRSQSRSAKHQSFSTYRCTAQALTHTHTHNHFIVRMVRISEKERDQQINGSLSSLEFEKVVQGFSDGCIGLFDASKPQNFSAFQCCQGHESHQHQFSSCTEKGDSDCTKKQEGNWIAQHFRWHSVNLSLLLGYRQWKSGMCESHDWRFVDHPSWSKHGHTIAPKWDRMKNPK